MGFSFIFFKKNNQKLKKSENLFIFYLKLLNLVRRAKSWKNKILWRYFMNFLKFWKIFLGEQVLILRIKIWSFVFKILPFSFLKK